MKKGKLLVFEGIDGSGKSTRAVIAFEYLKKIGLTVLFLTEPAKGFLGEKIREIVMFSNERISLLSQVFLFSANRAHFYETVIEPALNIGTWIVMDRSWISTIAYQGWGEGFGDSNILDSIDLITQMAIKKIKFDLCVLCDLSVEVALQRIATRGQKKDYFEKKQIDYAERMRKGYLDAITRYSDLNFHVLDTGDNLNGDVIVMEKQIENILNSFLKGEVS